MRHLFFAACTSVLIFIAVPAVAEDSAGSVITGMEYDVLKVVLAEYPSVSVDKTTLSGTMFNDLDKFTFKPPLGQDIVGDLNEKNKVSCELPAELIVQAPEKQDGVSEGRKSVRLSRAGFDKESKSALLVVQTTYYYPEDIMNEGEFILLYMRDGKWTVEKRATAWSMRLGK